MVKFRQLYNNITLKKLTINKEHLKLAPNRSWQPRY